MVSSNITPAKIPAKIKILVSASFALNKEKTR